MQRHQQLHPNTLIDDLPDWCASIQKALISPLIQRTTMAMKQEGLHDIALLAVLLRTVISGLH